MKYILSSIIWLIIISCSDTTYDPETKKLRAIEDKKLYKFIMISKDSTISLKDESLRAYFDSLREIDAIQIDTSLFDSINN